MVGRSATGATPCRAGTPRGTIRAPWPAWTRSSAWTCLLKAARRPAFAPRIGLGELGPRTASAEGADLYDAEERVGLQMAAVVNLPPQQVAGLVGEVMALAADNGRGVQALLIPEQPVPHGARVV